MELSSFLNNYSLQEATSQDQSRRLQRQLRDLKENYTTLQQKETEVNAKKNEFEKKLELGMKTMNKRLIGYSSYFIYTQFRFILAL